MVPLVGEECEFVGVCVVFELGQTCELLWYFSVKDTLNKGLLSNEDTVGSPNHTELCRNLSLNYVGTPLYTRQPTGSRWCPL